ncbi:MAG: DNA repair protein RecN, partial [Lentisphaerae bacterium]|nr:DNA repair protein RecN [Lentisphaerota bacterium]
AYVNGSAVTVSILRDLGTVLVDVHGPHEHQSLLRPRSQLDLLDAFAGLGELRAAVEDGCTRERDLAGTLEQARGAGLSAEDAEWTAFQIEEISRAGLQEGEEERLVAQHRRLANAQRLIGLADACRQGLAENDPCLLDQLGRCVRLLQELQTLDEERGGPWVERLELAVEQIRDLAGDLADYVEDVDLDGAALAQLEERLDLIAKLKRKYGSGIPEILGRLEALRQRLADHEHRAEHLAGLTAALAALQNEQRQRCAALSAQRRETAGALATAVVGKLRRLGFGHADFAIRVDDAPPGPSGADQVEFLFAPNAGEPMLPLRQIASSGEMARVMLAVKTVLTAVDQVPVLVFDEVDANIGGRTAVTVAEELVAIAGRHQVLCITHLAQIAAAGDRHWAVSKAVQDERTTASMQVLGPAEREQELARMLGAAAGSKAALVHAREMLAEAAAVRTTPDRHDSTRRKRGAVPA